MARKRKLPVPVEAIEHGAYPGIVVRPTEVPARTSVHVFAADGVLVSIFSGTDPGWSHDPVRVVVDVRPGWEVVPANTGFLVRRIEAAPSREVDAAVPLDCR